jgi:hypothetical protein
MFPAPLPKPLDELAKSKEPVTVRARFRAFMALAGCHALDKHGPNTRHTSALFRHSMAV